MPNAKAVSKDQLRAEIDELRFVGSRMANLCFNLSQSKHPKAKIMAALCQNWDAIERREPTLDLAAERLPNVAATSGESAQLRDINHISQLHAKLSGFGDVMLKP